MKLKLFVLGLGAMMFLTHPNFVFAQTNKPADAVTAPHVATDEEVKTLPNVGNKICPVSGDKVPAPGEKGEMGSEAVKFVYNGKIYNLCCPMCVKDFKKNPEKYSKIAEDEVKKDKATQTGEK